LQASVTAEAPRLDIYSFRGYLKLDVGGGEGQREGLSLNNTLWGNTFLASGTAIGIVMYTGREMKSILNIREQRVKVSRLDEEVNTLSKALFLFMVVLGFVITFSDGQNENWLLEWFRQVLLLASIIPISLRVNLDFAKLVAAYKINHDPEIKGAMARNSQIPDELGRVEYLLSDKTGTLTQNEMVFKKLSVVNVKTFEPKDIPLMRLMTKKNCEKLRGPASDVEEKVLECEQQGKKYRQHKRVKENVVRDLVTALAVCNNVTPFYNGPFKEYQASSPDEIALVKTAEELNCLLLERTQGSIQLQNPAGQKETYKVLANFPFTSESKRMGIILRHEESGRIMFYLKGADTVMKDRVPELQRGFILDECEDMAREGLRTLVFAQKVLTKACYRQFEAQLKEAETSLNRRDQLTRRALELIEKDMELVGISGVEDKLQEDIAEAIALLRGAGIKVWMITGDKVETACCIAISTGLKANNDFYVIRDEKDLVRLRSKLDEFSCKLDAVLVIDGTSITTAMEHLRELFFEVACVAPAVVCCRVSPTQKAELTEGVKRQTGRVTLSIGDGGNDVGMIMSADVGVGIVGKEGRQAAQASDFSILRFRDVTDLLLWHGRLSYKNIATMSQFVIHRGLIISIIQAIFSISFYGVAIAVYNGWLMLGYTTVYTLLPVFCIVFDEDVRRQQVREFPELYRGLQKGRELSKKAFLIWLWKSVYQGAAIMLLSFLLFSASFVQVVTITFSALIVLEILNVFTILTRVRLVHAISLGLTLVVYFLSIHFMRETINVGILDFAFAQKMLLIVAVAWLPVQFAHYLRRVLFPEQH
jgi:phospholipid-translocating ATPase